MTEQRQNMVTTVTTSLAAAFNLLLVVVISWGVAPRIERSSELIGQNFVMTIENRKTIKDNHELLHENLEQMRAFRKEWQTLIAHVEKEREERERKEREKKDKP